MQSAAAPLFSASSTRAGTILQFPTIIHTEHEDVLPATILKPVPVPAPVPAPKKPTIDEIRQQGKTSDGRPLATEGDSIKSLEHIEEIANYFLSKKQLRNYCLFVVGTGVGLRMGDLLQTKISHYMNEDGSFKDELRITEQKRNRRVKPVITDRVKDAIALYLSTRDYDLDDYLFVSRKGGNRPIDMSQAYRVFNDMSKVLKLPYHISTHSMRKTFAYWTIRNNPGNMTILIQLQEMFGHTDIRTTLRYAGITRDEHIELYKSLADLFNSVKSAT